MIETLKLLLRRNKTTKGLYVKLSKLKRGKNRRNLQKYKVKITRAIFDMLDGSEFKYFYASGSLLGLVRDKGFMTHDDDIDLGIVINSSIEFKRIPEIFKEHGFKLLHYYTVDGEIAEYAFHYKNTGVGIDVFGYYKDHDKLHAYYLYQNATGQYTNKLDRTVSVFVYDGIDSFKYVNYCGVKLCIPEHADKILFSNYGPNWRIKDTGYDVKTAPGHMVTNKRGRQVNVE